MKSIRTLLCLFSMILFTHSFAQQLPDSVIIKLKQGIAGFKDRYPTPAIVVAIAHNDEVIFTEALGYTDIENKVPATIDSKFPIMSVTKTFTATMFMQLAERSRLTMGDDVRIYLPEFNPNYAAQGRKGITLLQLATHTSGLPRNSPADLDFARQMDGWLLVRNQRTFVEPSTRQQFLLGLKEIQKEYPAYELLSYGDRHYSNLGYSMLGIAIERAAKSGYEQYVVNNICVPLKMTNSGFITRELRQQIATGYLFDDSSKKFLPTPFFLPASAMYAGGMYSTVVDLAKYISFQYSKSDMHEKILSADYRSMMHSLRIGWKPNYPIVFHEGSILGYRSVVVFNPDKKIGWVILTNTSNFDFNRINEYIGNLITPVFSNPPVTDLSKYTGTYELAGKNGTLQVYLFNDSLFTTYVEDIVGKVALVSTGRNRFKSLPVNGHSIEYEFIVDENSTVTALNVGQLMWTRKP